MDVDFDRGGSQGTNQPIVIGIVGSIASGKSTVAELLSRRGAEVIDADQVYHDLVAAGSPLLKAIVDRFGSEVVLDDGSLDRVGLARIVFADAQALADLELITHAPVVSEIRERIMRSSAPVVALEAIKLFQSGLADDVDQIWFVEADQARRIARLMSRNSLSRPDALRRAAASRTPLPAGRCPDVVIDNSGSLAATREAVNAAWNNLEAEAGTSAASVAL